MLFIITFSFAKIFSGVVFAVSDSADLNLQVTGTCNNNGVCDPGLQESILSCPADCSGSPGDGGNNSGGLIILLIQRVSVEDITPGSANIFWQTTKPAYCNILFGRTREYENGTISETQFKISHYVKLTDLQNSTTYHFKINCKDTMDFSTETGDYSFSTLSILNNVSNLKISTGDTKLTLTWDNPSDSDFDKVRILRSTDFYPIDLDQGKIVYEGDNNSFIDTDLTNGIRYYYTIFVYNLAGDRSSSGAIVSGVPGLVTPSASPPVPPFGWEMSFGEFNFFVEGEDIVWFGESTIKISAHKQLLVSIYDKQLPPETKTIIFTLEKDNKTSSFILGSDETKVLRQTAIPPTLGVGNYSITISIFNQENELTSEIKGELQLGRVEQVFQFRWYYELPIYIIVLLIVVILIIFGLKKERNIFDIIRRKRTEKFK